MSGRRPFLAIAALAIAACQTERKPLIGYDKRPPGIVLDTTKGGGELLIWPIFDLPPTPQQIFRPRLNDQDLITVISQEEGFYDYSVWDLQGWTGGQNGLFYGVPASIYTVEIVDPNGQSWGRSAPLPVPDGLSSSGQNPTVMFAHFDDQVGSWTIDPTTADADPTTDEITVTNLVGEDVVVERCQIVADARTSCTPVGTVAPQGDLRTVETVVKSSSPPLSRTPSQDHQALFIHLASDASQSYQRDLIQASGGNFGTSCQIERILVHGPRSGAAPWVPAGSVAFALSSCYGYTSSGF